MSRTEFTRKTKQDALRRSRDVICAKCSTPFDRGYAICASRAAKPQFCSETCRVAEQKERAAKRLADRFWSRVEIRGECDCWLWKGRRNARGYGVFDNGNRPHVASRFAYELMHGAQEPHVFICHSCDTPACVNPKHLWPGTHQENMDDAASKDRMRGGTLRGSAVNTAKFTREDVLFIRKSAEDGPTLAARYGVSKTAIYKVRRRENWGWLHG